MTNSDRTTNLNATDTTETVRTIILPLLERVPLNTHITNEYYGPYNSLLFLSFQGFPAMVIPPTGPSLRHSFFDVVLMSEFPTGSFDMLVFHLSIHVPSKLQDPAYRVEADGLMRERMSKAEGHRAIPVLHGVCAFGTKVAFYRRDAASGTFSPNEPDDDVPESLWEFDLLEEEGISHFNAVVRDVKRMCANV